jgi:hypothetical protein
MLFAAMHESRGGAKRIQRDARVGSIMRSNAGHPFNVALGPQKPQRARCLDQAPPQHIRRPKTAAATHGVMER